MANISIMSWNLRGLNNPVKRARCLDFLRRKHISLALIQETHLRLEDVLRFRNRHFKVVSYSCATSKCKGVLIVQDRKLPLQVTTLGGDDQGRFTYIVVKIHHIKMLFALIYAPNEFDQEFFQTIRNTLFNFPDHYLFLGGDMNTVVSPTMDHTSGIDTQPQYSRAINNFMSDLHLVDLWRFSYPNLRKYSFYSTRHKSYSRIDYMLVSHGIQSNLSDVDIFNDCLLSHPTFLEQLKSGLQEFLHFNEESSENPQIIWEATKCFIRGNCIAFASMVNSARNQRFTELENTIQATEAEQLCNPPEDNLNKLTALRGEFNSISMAKAAFAIHRTRQKYYYHGERISKLLALKLKDNESKATINAIKTKEGITTNPDFINQTFKDFFEELYKSDTTAVINKAKAATLMGWDTIRSILKDLLLSN
uniref:exodeoxyribonuclease III n=1 Tax=Astyanax mexicanus TaxID=7994 RepID=A0A3B1K9P9_ASTMX